MHSVPDYCKYLKSKFTTTSPAQKLFRGVLACGVDYEKYELHLEITNAFAHYVVNVCQQLLCESCEIHSIWDGKVFVY